MAYTRTNTSSDVRSPTRTSTSSDVRSPTRTSTRANTRGNFTATVTGGAGAGATNVTINLRGRRGLTGYRRIPFLGRTPPGEFVPLSGLGAIPMTKMARFPVADLPPGVPGLVRWIKSAHPAVYRQLGMRLRTSRVLDGLGVAPGEAAYMNMKISPETTDAVATAAKTPGMAATLLSTVKDLLAVGLPMYQQNEIFKLQVKRAQAGLAPLDTAAVADLSAARVNVGVDSGTRNTLMWVVGGLGGVYLLSKLLGRR